MTKRVVQPQATALRYWIPHPGQALILNHPARFRVVACGRRFGKTEAAKLDLMITAFDGGVAWWVLPTYTMAQEVWGSLLLMLEPLAESVDRSSRQIYFANGGQIAVRSGHEPDRLRGTGLDSVVIDEAAYCHEEVWHAIRPALSDRQSVDYQGNSTRGRALLLSTPRGRNWFWEKYQMGMNPDEPDWVSWRMPTRANPLIPREEVESARRDMPERQFREEYAAEFLDDYGTVFRGVRECVVGEYVGNRPNEPLCFGIDWGRMDDYTAVVVMGMISRRVYAVTRFRGELWAVQRDKIKALVEKWRPQTIVAESNSIGGPNIELLMADGLPVQPFTTTAANKTRLIDTLALALESRGVGLPDDAVLVGELMAYEMTRTPTGDYRYSAPPGGHDDTVMALALALHAAHMPTIARLDYREQPFFR